MADFDVTLAAGESVDIGEQGVSTAACRNGSATITVAFADGTTQQDTLQGHYSGIYGPSRVIESITNNGADDVDVSFKDQTQPMDVDDEG